MKKFKERILQSIADYIIERLTLEINSQFYDDRVFYFYLEMGLWLDFYATEYFDVELN